MDCGRTESSRPASGARRKPPRPSARRVAWQSELDPRLIEIGQGEWEGRTHAELEVSDADRYRAWREAAGIRQPPGGEPISAATARVASLLDELLAAPAGTTCVVSHGGTLRIFARLVLELADDRSWALDVDNASLGAVDRHGGPVAPRALERHRPPAGHRAHARGRGGRPAAGALSSRAGRPVAAISGRRSATEGRSRRRSASQRSGRRRRRMAASSLFDVDRVSCRPEYDCQTFPSATTRIGSPCFGSWSSSHPAYS